MKCLYVDMGDTSPFSGSSAACYAQRLREAEAAGIKVRALQISNPHNPSGTISQSPFPPLYLID
jgi:aspartate/methionine/tyrosine aminotransferase